MTNNTEHSFAIIRFNEKTYKSGGVMAVVKGIESAQRTLNDFEWCQSQEDRSSGWRYFLEESDLHPGTDPAKATKLRQFGSTCRSPRQRRPVSELQFGNHFKESNKYSALFRSLTSFPKPGPP